MTSLHDTYDSPNVKVALDLASVQRFAKANNIRFVFADNVQEAVEASGDALGLDGLLYTYSYFTNVFKEWPRMHSTGTSNTAGRFAVVVGLNGWNEDTYATAMHEIGHILVGTSEVKAWEWAEAHAERWTPAMQANRIEALSSYIANGQPIDA